MRILRNGIAYYCVIAHNISLRIFKGNSGSKSVINFKSEVDETYMLKIQKSLENTMKRCTKTEN